MDKKIELKVTDGKTGLSVKATIDYEGHLSMVKTHSLSLVDDVLKHLVIELDSEIKKNKK
jgi:hypothetical protein